MDSLAWPYSDVGNGAEIRAETQKRLKAVYVDPILEAGEADCTSTYHQRKLSLTQALSDSFSRNMSRKEISFLRDSSCSSGHAQAG